MADRGEGDGHTLTDPSMQAASNVSRDDAEDTQREKEGKRK